MQQRHPRAPRSASAQWRHSPERLGVRSAGLGEADAAFVQERGDVLGRQNLAQQRLGRAAADASHKPLLERQQLLKLRILLEISVRDLAADGAPERRQIDALHHRLRVALRSDRRELRRADERPTPVSRNKDDEHDGGADKFSHKRS